MERVGGVNMPIILTKIDSLASRGQNIRTMLRPISRIKQGPAWEQLAGTNELIIAIHDGSRTTSEFRSWRFSTFVQNLDAMYFELWKRLAKDEKYWYLDKAYLSIYQNINEREKEFLCLHCDPNLSLEAEEPAEKMRNRTSSQLDKKGLKSKTRAKQPGNKTD